MSSVLGGEGLLGFEADEGVPEMVVERSEVRGRAREPGEVAAGLARMV